MWLGAHPGGSCTVERGGTPTSLTTLIADDPQTWLGPSVAARFGARLPYLMKVLAAEAPLSLQVHPDADQAREGFAAEETATSPAHRNYVDPYHKPELLVAVSPFEALCGFQDPAVSVSVFEALDVRALKPVVAALQTGREGLCDAVEALLTWPLEDQAALVEAAVKAADAVPVDHPLGPALRLAARLAAHYPADPGALVALLLNHVILSPGEAIWMPAGNLHAYLRGVGVEIMAASDNVLRGGLTPKHVDVPEVLRVLRFEVLDNPVVQPVPVAPGVVSWPAPAAEFALHRVRLDEAVPQARLSLVGPRVALCLRGKVTVDDGAGAVIIRRGQAAVGAAGAARLTLVGEGEAYVASVAG